jgi:hypothetical protein
MSWNILTCAAIEILPLDCPPVAADATLFDALLRLSLTPL